MRKFSELGIKPATKSFIGKHIELEEILDKPIIVHDFDIRPSKHPKGNYDRTVYLQIEFEGKKRLFWSSSIPLIETSKAIPEDAYPFETKIIKNFRSLNFS